MIVAVHQPNYLPYLGFFHKMWLADVFVLYDTAQFSKNEFHNRNRIKTPQGLVWLTVPVRSPGFRPIREIEVDSSKRWADRHWQSLIANCSRAPYFESHTTELRALYQRSWTHLSALNEAVIHYLRMPFGLTARILRSSDMGIPEGLTPSQKLAEITRRAGGDTYLSGPGGAGYLERGAFDDISLLLQDFRHPEYPQLWGPFVSNLSAVDLLVNVGDAAKSFLEKAGTAIRWPS